VKLAAAILIVSLPVLAPIPAQAATLTVHVENIDKKGGLLHVALYTEDLWNNDDSVPTIDNVVPAAPPVTTVVMKNVKPGIYGIKSFQDANRNGRFDQNFLGLPLERYGFSRDARPIFSEPGFDRTRFAVKDGDNEITIHLQ
jgi:uncharacterized protein (DUF2141 family)